MAHDPKQSPKRGWRVGGAGDDAKRGWRKEAATTTPTGRRWSLRAWFWPLLLLFLTTIGTLIWVATRLAPPTPAYLVVLGADYTENLALPHNLHGWHSAQSLHEFASKGEWSFLWWPRRLFGGQADGQGLHTLSGRALLKWAEGLADCKEEAVILYLTAHAGADRKGVYFVPHDCNPYAADEKQGVGNVLYLKELLANLPEKKKKLVLLEVTASVACWPLGQLHNDFARQLTTELERDHKNIPNLVVLSASDVDQRSWASTEWGRSAFGHFVLEGMAGAADANYTGRVDADELVRYVTERVTDWTRANRDETQTPLKWASSGTEPASMELAIAEKATPPPTSPPTEAAILKLKAAWQDCEALREQVPAPAVYTPQQWRRYLDTLIRYEEVVRAGDPTGKASDLQRKLGRLKSDIEQARQPSLTALNNLLSTTLPMHAALGQTAPTVPAAKFNELWRADEEKKWEEVWGRLRRDLGPERDAIQESLLAVKAAEHLLREAGKNLTSSDLRKMRRLLQWLQREGARRPVEAHTLLILEQHLVPGLNRDDLPADLLKHLTLAVRVGLLAEETALAVGDLPSPVTSGADPNRRKAAAAHPSSERVHPWIAQQLAEADKLRITGMDWLFGANEGHWKKAAEQLAEAEKRYRKVQQQTTVLREAFALRDETLAELPYYGQWLARFRITPDNARARGEETELKKLVEALERAWNHVHLLSTRLSNPDLASVLDPPAATKQEEKPVSLEKRLDPIREAFKEVKDAYVKACQGFQGDAAIPSQWHQLDAVLAVPFLPTAQRHELLLASRRIGTALQKGYENRAEKDRAPRPKDEERPRTAAERQGRLALAALGHAWVEERPGKEARGSVENLKTKVSTKFDRWWNDVREAGEQIGSLWRELPGEVRKLSLGITDADQWLGNRDKKDYLEAITPDLARAEAWCRQLDGAAADTLTYDPVGDQRRVQLHALLLAHAQRAWDDHWWCTREDHDSKKAPYYFAAVETYLKAAQELIVQDVAVEGLKDLRRTRARAAETRLGRTSVRCEPLRSKMLLWTTERTLRVEWTLTSKGVPPGTAMFRLQPHLLLKPAPGAEGQELRAPRSLQGAADILPYQLALQPPATGEVRKQYEQVDKAQAVVEGVFRGQPIDRETRIDIDIYREPDTIVYQRPPEPKAGLAVRADRQLHLGTITLVIDCSGSMGVSEGQKRGRFDDAKDALKEVLKKVPTGTTLSIWAFSHREAKSTDGIDCVVDPLTWDATKFLKPVMDKLDKLTPSGYSPIVDAMIKARSHLTGKAGLKSLVLLSDGEDSEKFKNLEDRPAERDAKIAAEIQREFGGGTAEERYLLSVIIFQSNAAMLKRAERQFKDAIENLPLPGNWLPAENPQKLAADLLRSVRPRLRLLRNNVAVPNMPQGFRVTFDDERIEGWSRALDAEQVNANNLYDAWMQNVHQSVGLRSGECMVMLLKPDPVRGIRFERGLFADLYGSYRRVDRGDSLLAVMQNQHKQGGNGKAVELLLSVESKKGLSPAPGTGQNVSILGHPPRGFLWLEMTVDGKPRPGLRWGNVWFYPGMTWRINHDDWKLSPDGKAVTPELRVWWQEDPRPETPQSVAHREPNIKFEDALRDQERNFANVKVVIESVEVARHAVEGQPQGVNCLVVRLRHEPPERPVWITLTGANSQGAEHHYYSKAGKVTAFFWDVTQATAQQGFTLGLTSLEEFKKTPLRVDEKDLKLGVPDVAPGPKPVDLER